MLYLVNKFQQKEAAVKRLEDSLSDQEKQMQEKLKFQVVFVYGKVHLLIGIVSLE